MSNCSTNSKQYDNSDKLVIGKTKDETEGVAIQEFVGLKLKIHSSLKTIVNIKKNKSVNKNVTATISHIEYKNIMLNNKSIRICPSMNRI